MPTANDAWPMVVIACAPTMRIGLGKACPLQIHISKVICCLFFVSASSCAVQFINLHNAMGVSDMVG